MAATQTGRTKESKEIPFFAEIVIDSENGWSEEDTTPASEFHSQQGFENMSVRGLRQYEVSARWAVISGQTKPIKGVALEATDSTRVTGQGEYWVVMSVTDIAEMDGTLMQEGTLRRDAHMDTLL